MEVKSLTVPYPIHQCEAYVRRLVPCKIRNDLKAQLKKYWAGYKGEKAIAATLQNLSRDYLVIHDLRLFNGMFQFQIDCLILHTNFFLVLEVKNISGLLEFNRRNQVIRSTSQKHDVFDDPVNQLAVHQNQLQDWLADHWPRLPESPIEGFVVNAAPGGLYETNNLQAEHATKIIRRAQLNRGIFKMAGQHPEKLVTRQTLFKLADHLVRSHEPKKINLIDTGDIALNQIRKGVRCTRCGFIGMKRQKRRWHCPSCGRRAATDHISSLRDYALIIKDTLTNRECRDFLQLESEDVAKYILQTMNLKRSGNTKGRVYHLNGLN